ncbi:MAG TPA: acetoacetate--CoA ligase [Pirellulales bacterium]|jgi:acetoacetyl-CoA synthetase|nr:acetoacetate--CoA ligase [Pirellulales bacterium]
MSNPLMWKPSPEQIEAANLTTFARFAREQFGAEVTAYAALYRWSIDEPADFWKAFWNFAGVRASRPFDVVMEGEPAMPGTRWFVGSRLNFAENLLRYRDDRPAIVTWTERGRDRERTYRQLYAEVAQLAAALTAAGLEPGDRVAGYLPNTLETVVAMLATTSLGGVWSSCSPDFGTAGVIDRFGQIEPKFLFAAGGYRYAGKWFDLAERVATVRAALPSLSRTIVVPYPGEPRSAEVPAGCIDWQEFVAGARAAEIPFKQLPFDHPLYILYSSGTTGVPKCIVHSAGGILLQHLKEHLLHCDLRRNDRLMYFTTCGWMMWNWLVSSLAVGLEMVLYDGSPLAPSTAVLFDLAQAQRLTVLGTSPKYLAAIAKAGLVPRETHDLSSLRLILSTGAPLGGAGFDYVYESIKSDVHLASISGGTDICACFAIGNPVAPVYRGEMQTRGLGMQVEVYDEQGRSIVGRKGELVCTRPFPSMPLGFWNDPSGEKYEQAYFQRFPGVWCHGDYAEITDHDGLVIHGRSDAVLNPGGVRIGTAEIYRQVEQVPDVLESLVIGQQWQDDVRVVLFVKLRPGLVLDEPLKTRICCQIRQATTPRHVPAKVVQVADIPHTKSGKIVELAVRDVVHGRPVQNAEALANPEALELFRNLPELG